MNEATTDTMNDTGDEKTAHTRRQQHMALPAVVAAQPRASRDLVQAVRAGRCHAFMLSGERGSGTPEAATWLAQTALCPQGGCGACEVCRRVVRRVHPDLVWMSAEGLELRAGQIDELIEVLSRTPFEATAQVAVIDDAETLSSTNAQAANRLLKVLEEPMGTVLFVLLASRPHQVLPTIRSRVIEIPFVALADDAMREVLATEAGAPADAGELVRVARGDITRARELRDGGPARARRDVVMQVAQRLAHPSRGEPIAAASVASELIAPSQLRAGQAADEAEQEFAQLREQMPADDATRAKNAKDPDSHQSRVKRRARRAAADELRATLIELAAWYRDIAAVEAGAEDTVSNVDRLSELQALRGTAAARNAVAALDAIDELVGRIATNIDAHLAVSALCAELLGLAEGRVRSRRAYAPPLAY